MGEFRPSLGGRGRQGLIEVGDQVIYVLNPNRQAHNIWPGTRRNLLFLGQLTMGCRGRVNDQAARITKVGNMAEDLDGIHQFGAGRIAALNCKGEQCARAFGVQRVRPVSIG